MKIFRALCVTMFCAANLANHSAVAADAGIGPSFKGPLGLQLYSLREQFAKDFAGTLDKVRDMGFKNVELAGLYKRTPESKENLTAEEFKKELDARGLKAISGHFGFEDFKKDPEKIAQQAKALGMQYAGCAWIPHSGAFDEKTCHEAIKVFNNAGAVLAKHGIKFFYHTHGYEFQPFGSETLFDLLLKETKPGDVNYEMDVFWIVHGGQDPVALFKKYGDRFQLVHLKDMKQGTPVGLLTGSSDVKNDVALGTGRIDYPHILPAAEQAGVKWYFIEDESPTSEQQIPITLHYLENVKW